MRIYHTSDLHDRRRFVEPLRRLRSSEPGWLFDCGDSLRGSQTIYHRTEPIIAELARAGYDAQAIGNREFHYMFAALAARARQMQYPLLCSNLIDLHGRKLPFLDHLRVENAHGSIYLAGLLIMQYPPGSFWERIFGWRFLDPVAVITQHAQRVRDDECFIVLSHLGLSLDRKLAAAVPRIDLLLGGHSHDTLAQPYMVGAVPIVHAGPYGRFASLTELRKERARARLDRFELVPLVPS